MGILLAKLEDGLDYDQDGVIPCAGVVMFLLSATILVSLLVVTLTSVGVHAIGWAWPFDFVSTALPPDVWIWAVVGNMAYGLFGLLMAVPILARGIKQDLCLACGQPRG